MTVGDTVGSLVIGDAVGSEEGLLDAVRVGLAEGVLDGLELEVTVGDAVGFGVTGEDVGKVDGLSE